MPVTWGYIRLVRITIVSLNKEGASKLGLFLPNLRTKASTFAGSLGVSGLVGAWFLRVY